MPEGTTLAASRHVSPMASAIVLSPYHLATCPTLLGAIPVAQCYWIWALWNWL